MSLLPTIKHYAQELGFDACGIAPCRPMERESGILSQWIEQGFHADMDYMKRYTDLRTDPSLLFEDTKSVIVCLISYKTAEKYPENFPQIASYARCTDYHYSVKGLLNQLLARIKQLEPTCEGRAFVDSAPIMEKNWAIEAGLGWAGRNSLLIHPKLGSFCFIGIILTTLELDQYDAPYTKNHCGTCRKCMDSCPTGAIQDNGLIDTRLCLSYQTIENRGVIPEYLVPKLENRMFGCDTCQDVCPWNTKPTPENHAIFEPIEGIYTLSKEDWLSMSGGGFKRRFGNTPLARAGLKKLKQTLSQT